MSFLGWNFLKVIRKINEIYFFSILVWWI